MKKDYIALSISCILLSVFIYIYFDLFSFSKNINLPDWAMALPFPMSAPSLIVALSLIPALIIPNKLYSVFRVIVACLLISPIAGLINFSLIPAHQHNGLLYNILFNYFWIIFFHCLIPAVIIFSARIAYKFFYKNLIISRTIVSSIPTE